MLIKIVLIKYYQYRGSENQEELNNLIWCTETGINTINIECNIMHFRTDNFCEKPMLICSKSLILLCLCEWLWIISVSLLWKRILNLSDKSISRRGKEDQYCCISHRWDIIQTPHLDVRNIIWVSCAQKLQLQVGMHTEKSNCYEHSTGLSTSQIISN